MQVVYTFSKQLWGLHSPSTCLVQNFQIFTGDNFFHTYTLHTCFRVHSPYSYLVYTLQAHVRFQIFKFSRELFFSYLYSPQMFQDSLCIQLLSKHMLGLKFTNFHGRSFFHAYTLHTCFRVHSPYSYLVYTLQAHVRFKIFEFPQKLIVIILTLSTHVSGFTLHTVIRFTLSKHMLGSKFSNFLRRSLFHAYTLHTCFRVHSPYSNLVYTLQAHVRFNIFGFHFFNTYTLHSCFRVHSPCSCFYTLQADVTFQNFL